MQQVVQPASATAEHALRRWLCPFFTCDSAPAAYPHCLSPLLLLSSCCRLCPQRATAGADDEDCQHDVQAAGRSVAAAQQTALPLPFLCSHLTAARSASPLCAAALVSDVHSTQSELSSGLQTLSTRFKGVMSSYAAAMVEDKSSGSGQHDAAAAEHSRAGAAVAQPLLLCCRCCCAIIPACSDCRAAEGDGLAAAGCRRRLRPRVRFHWHQPQQCKHLTDSRAKWGDRQEATRRGEAEAVLLWWSCSAP